MSEPTYPCVKCGKPRTKAEGGSTFTVCDACWDAGQIIPETAREQCRTGEAIRLTINAVEDIRRGFAKYVDPARWVEQVQEPLRSALTASEPGK